MSNSERKYATIARTLFAGTKSVSLSTNEWLESFEADLVIRVTCADSTVVTIDIELDGPSHHASGSGKRFDDLRDDYLRREHGVFVERWNLMSRRNMSHDEIASEIRATVLKHVPSLVVV